MDQTFLTNHEINVSFIIGIDIPDIPMCFASCMLTVTLNNHIGHRECNIDEKYLLTITDEQIIPVKHGNMIMVYSIPTNNQGYSIKKSLTSTVLYTDIKRDYDAIIDLFTRQVDKGTVNKHVYMYRNDSKYTVFLDDFEKTFIRNFRVLNSLIDSNIDKSIKHHVLIEFLRSIYTITPDGQYIINLDKLTKLRNNTFLYRDGEYYIADQIRLNNTNIIAETIYNEPGRDLLENKSLHDIKRCTSGKKLTHNLVNKIRGNKQLHLKKFVKPGDYTIRY